MIELKRGEIAQVVLNQLYKLTPDADDLRHHHAGDRRQPAAGADAQGAARHFLDHRKTVVIRRTRFDLRKAEERAHILRGPPQGASTTSTR